MNDTIKHFSHEWFLHSNFWFNQSDEFDKYINNKYKHLLQKEKMYKILKEEFSLDKYETYLGCLLICDQLVRHIYRNPNENEKKIINTYTLCASNFTNLIIDNKLFEISSPEQQCFILLPWRHLNNIEKMEKSLIMIKEERIKNDHSIYKRFYKATIQKLANLNNDLQMKMPVENISYNNNLLTVLDKETSCQIIDPSPYVDFDEKIMETLEYFIVKYNLFKITISLSGGVDSSVLLYCFKELSLKYELEVQALHINYNNRSTSNIESDFCSYLCNIYNIPCYVRKINEISRNMDVFKKDRDFYEKITRKIRYDCYEKLEGDVILGHIKDDLIENIFANIIKEKNFDNLLGMNEYHFDQVNIYRPLLPITKQEIYDFASKYKIPFLYDSTPDWSERGQKRDKLIPFLKSFDERIISGLLKLSDYTTKNSNITKKVIEEKLTLLTSREKLVKNQEIAIIDNSILNYSCQEWKIILILMCRHYKFPYISLKCIENSFNKLKNKFYQKKITLRTYLTLKKRENNIVIIYH